MIFGTPMLVVFVTTAILCAAGVAVGGVFYWKAHTLKVSDESNWRRSTGEWTPAETRIWHSVHNDFSKLDFPQKWAVKVAYENPGILLNELLFRLKHHLGFAEVERKVDLLLSITNFLERRQNGHVYPNAGVAKFVEAALENEKML